MNASQKKQELRTRRHARIRAKVSGTGNVPRLSVFRSNKFIYAQLIDDERGITFSAGTDMKVPKLAAAARASA